MRTLIISPHMDDEALSCGALIRQRVKSGDMVHVAFIHGRKYPDAGAGQHALDQQQYCDMMEAAVVLGYGGHTAYEMEEGEPGKVGYYNLLLPLEQLKDTFRPDEVVVPSSNDMNQDHRHLADIMKIVLRPANLGTVKRVLAFRSFDTDLTRPSYYVTFGEDVMEDKLKAVSKYSTEAREVPHPRAPENIRALHSVLGSYAGATYAEGYDLLLQKE